MTYKVWVDVTDFRRRMRIALVQERADYSISVAQPLVFKDVPPNELSGDQEMFDGRSDQGREILQAFMDAAWEVGLRPTGMTDTTAQTSAMREHLGDLRMIVGAQLAPPVNVPIVTGDPITPELSRRWDEWMKHWGMKRHE